MENLVIEPLKGYGDIKFGMSVEEIISVYGTPSNNEEMESLIEENENYSVLYDYDEEGLSICFEGMTKTVVASISTNNEDATLFGERVYEMNRNQIVDLMKRDSEIKILIGCTEEEKLEVYKTHNETQYMKGILIRR